MSLNSENKLKVLFSIVTESAGPVERKKKEKVAGDAKSDKSADTPCFTKKEIATVAQRIEILDTMKSNGWSQKQTVQKLGSQFPNLKLNQPLISPWVKDKSKWREQYNEENTRGRAGTVKRVKQFEHPELEEMLELWVARAMGDGVSLSGELIRQKGARFSDLLNIPANERLAFSDGWLAAFKKRTGLKEFKRHGEAGSVKPEDVAADQKRVQEILEQSGYGLEDIFNMDETGLFWA